MNDYRHPVLENFEWQQSVKSRTITAEPTSGVNRGDRYIIPVGATGTNWAGNDNRIAFVVNLSPIIWSIVDTEINKFMICGVEDENKWYWYNGSTWVMFKDTDENVKADASDTTPGYLTTKVDNVTIEVDVATHKIRVKDDGIDENKINTSALGDGLTGGSGTKISVEADVIGGANLGTVVDANVNGIAIRIDDITIGENGSNQLYVKPNSIDASEIDETGNFTWVGTHDFSGGIVKVANPVNGDEAVNLDYMQAYMAGLDPQESVLAVQEDNTLDPGATPTIGDRYIIKDSANLNANFGTITGIGDGDIVEYDGTNFVVKYDVSVNTEGGHTWDESTNVRLVYNGTAWVTLDSIIQHNSLAGKQGGILNEYYHLTSAEHNALVGGGSIGSTYHDHNDIYFTEAELGSSVASSEGALLIGTDAKSNLGGAVSVEAALEYINSNWSTISNTDEKVKISATDTTSSYLNDAIGISAGITKTIINPGADETITFAIDFDNIPDGTSYQKVAASEVDANGNVTRLNDGANTVTALEGKTAYDRRLRYDPDLRASVANLL